jgi:phospholipase C
MFEADSAVGKHTRRSFLLDGASVAAAGTIAGRLVNRRRAWWRPATDLGQPAASRLEALRVLGRSQLRLPDSLPAPGLPVGTDTIPQIEHIVVLMLENHSYDNVLGMLGRQPRRRWRGWGDGFTLARDGLPTATNPYPDGRLQRAFRMPTTCQLDSRPSQEVGREPQRL